MRKKSEPKKIYVASSRRVMLAWLRRHGRCLPLSPSAQDVVYLLHQN